MCCKVCLLNPYVIIIRQSNAKCEHSHYCNRLLLYPLHQMIDRVYIEGTSYRRDNIFTLFLLCMLQAKEARRLKEFLEDYDDERDDPKYYK